MLGTKKMVIGTVAAIGLLVCCAGFGSDLVDRAGFLPGRAVAQEPTPTGSPAILSYSVGGILTADGKLWQYRPDQDRWLPIDEAFREEGRETKVVPLPVPVDEIKQMETFGFILTKSGITWLYDFATNQWRELPPAG